MSGNIFNFTGTLQAALANKPVRDSLLNRSTSSDDAVRNATAAIIKRVASEGDDALRAMAREYDGADLTTIEVPRDTIYRAAESLPVELRTALERAARNIRTVHMAAIPQAHTVETEPGVTVTRRPDPLDSVGVYAPGGRAVYPSSVLMGAIPARCAGVKQITLCSPPNASGLPSPVVLAAAAIAEVDRVFALGGAGAIAAMALGTATVPRVRCIVGPGNAYVAEAKLQLSGYVSIDSPAGPSELLVIADESADAAVVARELLAQAEHDPLTAVVAVCTSTIVAASILREVTALLETQPRREIIATALRSRGAVLSCDSIGDAITFASEYAPEHLLIIAEQASDVAARVRNAGTIFMGQYSSVSFGDYITGANHVLPTGRLAGSYSGLSTLDFMRWTTCQTVTRSAARALAADTGIMAVAENLPGHASAALAWGGES